MLDLDDLTPVVFVRKVNSAKHDKLVFVKNKLKYHESIANRWLVIGKTMSNKTYFRRICWKCFFKRLRNSGEIDISRLARKSRWYKSILSGEDVIPEPTVSPSAYFSWLFDISQQDLDTERKKFDTASFESFKRRYGDEAETKFCEYRARQAYTCSYEYMTKERGMSDVEWNDFNKLRSVTKQNMILRYGEEDGLIRWKKYCDKQSYAGNKLEYFVDLYGESEGTEKYLEVCAKKCINLENFIRKYGEHVGKDKFAKVNNAAYSKISQELFKTLDDRLGEYAKSSKYETKNGEATIYLENRIIKPDYILENKIIEFNGDYWHANPMLFEATDVMMFANGAEVYAKDIWNRDKSRLDCLKSNGYDVKIVWESDYKTNPRQVIDDCLIFLNQ